MRYVKIEVMRQFLEASGPEGLFFGKTKMRLIIHLYISRCPLLTCRRRHMVKNPFISRGRLYVIPNSILFVNN